jgi:hypothetical protein
MALGFRWTSHWRSCHDSAHLRLEIKTPYPCYREFIPQRKTTKERHHASVHNRRSNSRNRSSCRSRTCFGRTDQRGPAQAEWPVLAWSWGRERSRLGILATLRTAGQRLSNSTDNSPSHLGRLSGAELWCLSAPPLLRGLFHAGSRPPKALLGLGTEQPVGRVTSCAGREANASPEPHRHRLRMVAGRALKGAHLVDRPFRFDACQHHCRPALGTPRAYDCSRRRMREVGR